MSILHQTTIFLSLVCKPIGLAGSLVCVSCACETMKKKKKKRKRKRKRKRKQETLNAKYDKLTCYITCSQ
jgi:hypothetical protein